MGEFAQVDPGQAELTHETARAAVEGVPVAEPDRAGVPGQGVEGRHGLPPL